jgi:hypothetical protein
MRNRFLALAASGLVLALGAGPAMAQDGGFAGQAAEQVAGSQQAAQSNATSTQYQPSNTNISVRVLSPGNDGDVSQENNSSAESYAANQNDTSQTVDQSQSGSGTTAVQEALQKAGNMQQAVSNAESTQVKPSNKNISVRVLSPGDNGSVSQSNNSSARSKAENSNELDQDLTQEQSGGKCCEPKKPPKKDMNGYEPRGDQYKSSCCHGGTGIQAAGQEAYNKQYADSNAESKQIKPSNTNISVRVLSHGDDGDVEQSNNSSAESKAKNDNDTTQTIDQYQASGGCGCHGGELIQAAGQAAFNWQGAKSNAESKQWEPSNKALGFRFKSYGDGGYLSQSNNSYARSFAGNWNDLDQDLRQRQA